MFVVLLKIKAAKEQLATHMAAHKAWLQQGFDEQCFLLAGNLSEATGGGIIVHGLSADELTARLQRDPFVRENLVNVEVIGIQAAKTDARLAFLTEAG